MRGRGGSGVGSAMPSRWRNRALSCLVLILGLALRIADPGVVKDFQARYFDLLQQIRPRIYTPAPVRVVDIDDASLAKLGQWPWPRTVLAELIGRLNQQGPASIALDMGLAEPDRTSPDRVVGEDHVERDRGCPLLVQAAD